MRAPASQDAVAPSVTDPRNRSTPPLYDYAYFAGQQAVGYTSQKETLFTEPTTGGKKCEKLARFDLLPPDILTELAEHYGKGAKKYGDRNMEKGYPWSKTYAACQRHLTQFWNGENIDAETGSLHLIAAAWHCFTMAWFLRHGAGRDDRPATATKEETK